MTNFNTHKRLKKIVIFKVLASRHQIRINCTFYPLPIYELFGDIFTCLSNLIPRFFIVFIVISRITFVRNMRNNWSLKIKILASINIINKKFLFQKYYQYLHGGPLFPPNFLNISLWVPFPPNFSFLFPIFLF